jgi:hypothetical protein
MLELYAPKIRPLRTRHGYGYSVSELPRYRSMPSGWAVISPTIVRLPCKFINTI